MIGREFFDRFNEDIGAFLFRQTSGRYDERPLRLCLRLSGWKTLGIDAVSDHRHAWLQLRPTFGDVILHTLRIRD